MKKKQDKKENRIIMKFKTDKGALAMAVTVAVMLLVLAAIIITTVIANRATGEELPLPDGGYTPAALEEPDEEPGAEPTGDEPTADEEDRIPHFLLPVSGVLQKGHDAGVQVFSSTMGDYRVHLGIDIGTVAGAGVSAMADGVVTQIFDSVTMGHCVAVRHSGDACTVYKNLDPDSPVSLAVGMQVKAGERIGNVGESAMVEVADEPHLHLEMTVNGLQVDPTEYLDEQAMATLNEAANYEDES